MKQYNKPEIMLFAGAEESIAALEFNANYLSIGNEGGSYIAPKADDVW